MVVESAGTNSDDFAFLRLLLDSVGNNDAAGGLLIFLDTADHNAVSKWAEFHNDFSYWVEFMGEFGGLSTRASRVPSRAETV
jgi:hypothetical protein